MKPTKNSLLLAGLFALLAIPLSHCGKKAQILVDGSSTVYPITEAVAEEFRKVEPNVHVTIGISGTGGGFKKFCNKETDISDASRHIKPKEIKKCKDAGVEYIELPVAWDGLAVIVNKNNDFVTELSVSELKKIFHAKNPAKTWKDVRANWPDKPIKIYAPGQDSGTFDYFTETILGKKEKVRSDATFSEDDNVLVTGIAGDKNAIGFFGLAYYEENQDKLKLIAIVNPKTGKAVLPSLETVQDKSYFPLSRPIFIYPAKRATKRPEVKKFVNFYMDHAGKLARDVGYIPLSAKLYEENKKRFAAFAAP